MGFFDKLVPQIKGLQDTLFKSQGAKTNQGTDWQDHMTDEDIAELEKMGCDVTELREKQENKKQAQELCEQELCEQELSEQELREQELCEQERLAAIKLEKLDAYKQVPRSEDSEFFKDIAGKPPIFGSKKKWLDRYKMAEVIYAAIVQANGNLWEPGEEEYLPTVIVYTNDKKLRYDIDFLQRMAEKINLLQESSDVPDDCKEIHQDIERSAKYVFL